MAGAAFGDFYEQYPDVEIVLSSTGEVVDVAAHAADMALRYCEDATDVAGFDQVSDRPFYPYAAPGLVPGDSGAPEVFGRESG